MLRTSAKYFKKSSCDKVKVGSDRSPIFVFAALCGFMKCPLEVTVNGISGHLKTFSLPNFENLEDAMRQVVLLERLLLLQVEGDPLTSNFFIGNTTTNLMGLRLPPGLELSSQLALTLVNSEPTFRVSELNSNDRCVYSRVEDRLVQYITVTYEIKLTKAPQVTFETFEYDGPLKDLENFGGLPNIQALYARKIPIKSIIFDKRSKHRATISFHEVEQHRQKLSNPTQKVFFCEELARAALLLYGYYTDEGPNEALLTEAMYAGCAAVGLLELG